MNLSQTTKDIESIVGKRQLITARWRKQPYSKGWRYGEGKAFAVAKPKSLIEIWKILEICVRDNIIIIMQAANTGLTGGSTPFGDDYDRQILIINTMPVSYTHLTLPTNREV